MSEAPPAWRAAALAAPTAHGAPLGTARLKSTPEDFVVEERLGFEADGGAAHVLLQVAKRERDTLAVARALAAAGEVAARDVGFAGLKDRSAVATQWFTVPARRPAADWAGFEGDGFRVLAALPHSRKLRRGALAANAFRVVLREVAAPDAALAARLEVVAGRGVPNYFGPQRFGRDGSNLVAIERWCGGGPLPRAREARAFVLSAARALLFNAVLAERVSAASWDGLLPGECVNLDGRNSWFAAESVDAALLERLARHDIHPTGPLAGRGRGAGGESLALESRVLAGYGTLPAALEAAGLEAARRPLRLVPRRFTAERAGDTLTLGFELPPGAYATAVVRELLTTTGHVQEPDDA